MIEMVLSILWSQWTWLAGVSTVLAYKWLTANQEFFEKRNVPHEKLTVLFISTIKMILRKESMFEMVKRMHLKFKDHEYYGTFEIRTPGLIIASPEMIKQITIKDFDHFLNHRVILDAEDEPLFGNTLFSLKDQKWKEMRATVSPAFTGSKMRMMFRLIDECARNACKYLKGESQNKGHIEMDLKDYFTRYTNDVVATCAFGIQINSFLEKDNEFYRMAMKATNFMGVAVFKLILFVCFHKIMKWLKVRLFDEKFSKYFHKLVTDTMQQRAEKGIIRPDMVNLLMEARKGVLQASNTGKADANEGFATAQESIINHKPVNRIWTEEELVAQCFGFFLAGFETSSILMCFCAHELMENRLVQEKLIEEIDGVRKELGNEPLTYDAIQKMKYMDMVVSETLRKWPPAVATDRICNKPYVIRGKDGGRYKLEPGDKIAIPIVGLHYDPDNFPNPDKFDPERFGEGNRSHIRPFTYLPFGVGPRNCIGSRFTLMEAKAIIFHLLSEFTLEASPQSCIPLRLATSGFELKPKGGFWLTFKPRDR